MGPVERVNPSYRLFVATASSVIAAIAFDYLTTLLKNRLVALIALLIIVSFLVFLLNELLEQLIERSATLRKFLEGDEFIEGYWYDITIDPIKRCVIHGVLNRISYRAGEFFVDGVTYDLHGNRIATFRSETTAFSNRRLSFEYRGTNDEHNDLVEIGFTQLQFEVPPQSYSGFYLDYTARIHAIVHGYKVDRATIKKFADFTVPNSKHDFLLPLLAARQAELDSSRPPSPHA